MVERVASIAHKSGKGDHLSQSTDQCWTRKDGYSLVRHIEDVRKKKTTVRRVLLSRGTSEGGFWHADPTTIDMGANFNRGLFA